MKYQIYLMLVIIVIFFPFNNIYGANIMRPVAESNVMTKIMAKDFVKFSPTQYAHITGKKMNLWDKLSFQFMKIKMKQEIKKNPDLTLNDYMTEEKKMHRGWWILIGAVGGLFLVAIILVIAFGKAN